MLFSFIFIVFFSLRSLMISRLHFFFPSFLLQSFHFDHALFLLHRGGAARARQVAARRCRRAAYASVRVKVVACGVCATACHENAVESGARQVVGSRCSMSVSRCAFLMRRRACSIARTDNCVFLAFFRVTLMSLLLSRATQRRYATAAAANAQYALPAVPPFAMPLAVAV